MDRMTPEQAAALVESIDGLERKLALAEEQVERTHTLAKRLRFVVIALVAVVLALGYVVHQQHQQAVTNCENANKVRDGQRQIWEFYFEVVTAAAGPDSPESVLKFYDDMLTWITDKVLPDRDCENLDAEIPEIPAPPSFEQALKDAQAEEAASDG